MVRSGIGTRHRQGSAQQLVQPIQERLRCSPHRLVLADLLPGAASAARSASRPGRAPPSRSLIRPSFSSAGAQSSASRRRLSSSERRSIAARSSSAVRSPSARRVSGARCPSSPRSSSSMASRAAPAASTARSQPPARTGSTAASSRGFEHLVALERPAARPSNSRCALISSSDGRPGSPRDRTRGALLRSDRGSRAPQGRPRRDTDGSRSASPGG